MSIFNVLTGVVLLIGALLFGFIALVATLGLLVSMFATGYDKRREAELAALRKRGGL